MQEIFSWILQNWQLVLGAILAITSLVIAIIRKKPISVVSSFDSDIYRYCINAVNKAEVSGFKGNDKLNFAVDFVLTKISSYYPKLLDNTFLVDVIKLTIEEILSTPQKKGD